MSSKPNVAILYGGYSKEREVSLKSGAEILKVADNNRYNIYPIEISQKEWKVNIEGHSLNKSDFTINFEDEKIGVDYVLNIIHGTPGEDGVLSGYFDSVGVKYSNSGVFASAITFSKSQCNRLLSTYGITVPSSLVLRKDEKYNLKNDWNIYPCFVKPNKGGSSIGTSRVNSEAEIEEAVKTAFEHDTEVIVEQFINGREFTCGVLIGEGEFKPLPPTEIIVDSDFFDYNQKYSDNGAKEVTPAELSPKQTSDMQQIVVKVAELLQLKTCSRIDFILQDHKFYLIEVNTIPGMSSKSILPQQANAVGIDFSSLVNDYMIGL